MMKKVVLVDDDRDDAELFQEALEEVDGSCTFQHFENPCDALSRWEDTSEKLPDIIFLDLNLPQINGWQILQHVRQTRHLARIPVVMYTTSSRKQEREMAMELGANAFISKPSDFKQLKQVLNDILSQNMDEGIL